MYPYRLNVLQGLHTQLLAAYESLDLKIGEKIMLIKNSNFLHGRVSKHFVVTKPPIDSNDQITISIDLNEKAAILERYKNDFPSQHTVEDIRSGKVNHAWLLSGGTLIKNEVDMIAIGFRDGNAADPFAYTNIGAGRCDQRLEHHCYEEMATEFILCILKDNIWHQIDFGSDTRKLENIRIPAIWRKIDSIIKPSHQFRFQFGGINIEPEPIKDDTTRKVVVNWGDDEIETLYGYVWIDSKNHTIEFRLALRFDLSCYDKVEIFYGEGFAGYTDWKSAEQIASLIRVDDDWGQLIVTPFLRCYIESSGYTV